MIVHSSISSEYLHKAIKAGTLLFAGNLRLKIYGRLNCSSGKRMRKQNRVFFVNEAEAVAAGYRPCGHCMPNAYKIWKDGII